MRNPLSGRRQARAHRHHLAKLAGLAAAAAVTAMLLSASVTSPAGSAISEAGARAPADVPYSLPVRLPAMSASPPVAADAPYTPEVLNLIAQLEPDHPPTEAELANAWGQIEGTESRQLMVTGLFGPQADIDRLPSWRRNLTTMGEDPAPQPPCAPTRSGRTPRPACRPPFRR